MGSCAGSAWARPAAGGAGLREVLCVACCTSAYAPLLMPNFSCSLNVDSAAMVGDARIDRIIAALPQNCEEAGRICKK